MGEEGEEGVGEVEEVEEQGRGEEQSQGRGLMLNHSSASAPAAL